VDSSVKGGKNWSSIRPYALKKQDKKQRREAFSSMNILN
jgi:hypothetical protein